MGGLERTSVHGTATPYYSTYAYEIIFHDSTQIPNDPKDEQQSHKKKHLGNDPVIIVWSEQTSEFKASYFKLDSTELAIVIHPLHNGLFRIQLVYYKEKMETSDH